MYGNWTYRKYYFLSHYYLLATPLLDVKQAVHLSCVNQDYTCKYELSHLILFQASCPTPLLLIPRTFLDTAFNSLLSLSSFLMMSSPIPPPMLCHKMKWLWVGWLGWSFNTDKGHIMDTSKSRYCPHSPLIGNSKPWNKGTLYPTTNLNVLELYTNLQSFEYKIKL